MNRRDCLYHLQAVGLFSVGAHWMKSPENILKRIIPATGEKLPVIGLGTWQTFDVGPASPERTALKQVLTTLHEKGGTVVDSSPMYGQSEEVVGDLSSALNLNDKLFLATKVWTSGRENGIEQMSESFRLMRRNQLDLMQIHNLVDWQTHLKTLRAWKEEGKIRYIGLTHYTDSAHERLISIMTNEKIDFVQVNYNMLDRNAEKRLLPVAREKGVAVLINQPFESGSLFHRVKGKQLPAWSKEFDCHSWGQFFLKFILSHPAVTCAIPGTSKPHHMLDNVTAAFGKLPDEKQRQQMLAVI